MSTKPTPTPWRTVEGYRRDYIAVQADVDIDCGTYVERTIATVGSVTPEHAANAAFIVRAVNAHDELVGVLKPFARFAASMEQLGHDAEVKHLIRKLTPDDFRAAAAALAKANGGET